MPKAHALFAASAPRRTLAQAVTEPVLKALVRRLGPRPGEVAGRTVIAGKSYDHVRTREPSRHEIHPSNLVSLLGSVAKHGTVFKAYGRKGTELASSPDRHKAARAVVEAASASDGGGNKENDLIPGEEAVYA